MFSTIKRIGAIAALALSALAVSGCSYEKVEPATKGKVISASGYADDIKEPGRYWMLGSERMITLDTSTQNKVQGVSIRMKDKMELGVGVSFRGRIKSDQKIINAMFNDITVKDDHVSFEQVYNIYGRDVIARVVRDVLSPYTNEEFMQNQAEIQKEVAVALAAAMATSPIEVSNVLLGGIKLPDEITKAINKQNERELAIKTEENEQAVRMVAKANEMKLAEADKAIRILRAETIRKENEITNSGLSPMLIEYRKIEAAENIAKIQAENKNIVYAPYEAMGTTGMSNQIFRRQ